MRHEEALMRTLIAVTLGLLVGAQSANADDRARLVGTWRLVAFEQEFQDGRPAQSFLGRKWIGYTVFTAEGRTMSVWEAEGRDTPKTDEERAALLRTVHAFTGTYRYEGGVGVTTIDVAANPAQKGPQTRAYRLEGDRLHVTSPWGPSPTVPGSAVSRASIRFERAAQ
jgi:hypothetical protein